MELKTKLIILSILVIILIGIRIYRWIKTKREIYDDVEMLIIILELIKPSNDYIKRNLEFFKQMIGFINSNKSYLTDVEYQSLLKITHNIVNLEKEIRDLDDINQLDPDEIHRVKDLTMADQYLLRYFQSESRCFKNILHTQRLLESIVHRIPEIQKHYFIKVIELVDISK